MSTDAIVVFAKAPRAGHVKTRLADELGAVEAAAVYSELLRPTLTVVAEVPGNGEGVAIAEVQLVDSKSGADLGPLYDQLRATPKRRISPIHPGFPPVAYVFLTIVQGLGHLKYELSPTRRRIASRISGARTLAPPPLALVAVAFVLVALLVALS